MSAGGAVPRTRLETSRCPLCTGESDPAFAVADRNRGIDDRPFHYRRCRSCRALFLADVPGDLDRFYPQDYYETPSRRVLDLAAAAEGPRLSLLRRFVSDGSLLDIGASFGVFARAAANSGFDVTAIEMDARCCRYLEEVVGVRAIRSDAPEQAIADVSRPVTAITMWHVLEHLPRPWEVLARAVDRLEQGGVLGLATPNPDSVQFRLLGARWAHVDAPRHLFLIPFDALQRRAVEHGLRLGSVTTTDPLGRYLNRFGWEYAIRRQPTRHASNRRTRAAARLLALAAAPLERRGMSGTAYTAIFVKT
jgi:2-polyprenyl-3-methyl-5-hydroxy-6-metoxy-1,4-benzoquinol methylase